MSRRRSSPRRVRCASRNLASNGLVTLAFGAGALAGAAFFGAASGALLAAAFLAVAFLGAASLLAADARLATVFAGAFLAVDLAVDWAAGVFTDAFLGVAPDVVGTFRLDVALAIGPPLPRTKNAGGYGRDL